MHKHSEMYWLGYNGHCDGYDPSFHKLVAKSHSDARDLFDGERHARADMEKVERAFVPNLKIGT